MTWHLKMPTLPGRNWLSPPRPFVSQKIVTLFNSSSSLSAFVSPLETGKLYQDAISTFGPRPSRPCHQHQILHEISVPWCFLNGPRLNFASVFKTPPEYPKVYSTLHVSRTTVNIAAEPTLQVGTSLTQETFGSTTSKKKFSPEVFFLVPAFLSTDNYCQSWCADVLQ